MPVKRIYLHDGFEYHKELLRSVGTLIDPNNLGLYLVLAGFLSILLYRTPSSSRMLRRLAKIMHAVLVVGVFYTFSRASWLASFASAVLLIPFWLKRFSKATAIAFALLVVVGIGLEYPTIGQRAESVDTSTKSISTRLLMWKSTFHMFTDNPILGVGVGNFKKVTANYQPSEMEDPLSNCLNSHLLLLAELGIVGTSFYLILIGSIFYFTIQNPGPDRFIGCAFILAGLVNGFFSHILNIPPASMLWWAGLGVIASYFTRSGCDVKKDAAAMDEEHAT